MQLQGLSTLLFGVVMIAVFYFILIRPEKKRKKAMQEMRDALAPGEEITTIGGIIGTVVSVKENSMVIETGADRVRLQITRWAVGSVGVQTTETPQTENKVVAEEKQAIEENVPGKGNKSKKEEKPDWED
ncbi:MAG: preprotein translocase subunit YajC [Oscillospiraceae bacterium]|jgi:preprotein translocase subunit YajC|nr:preprotein translocase subunit YajC [Oscillospiraceae bacterium]